MTSSADSKFSLTELTELVPATDNPEYLQGLGSELVFTQTVTGEYLSFYWQEAEHFGLTPDQLVGHGLGEGFGPAALNPYLGRVRRVLDYLTPDRFTYPFRFGDQYLLFDLIVSPILTPSGIATTALIMGRRLSTSGRDQGVAVEADFPRHEAPNSDRYQKLLTQIAWNIRRTLDLETIWQQTVNGLGKALGVSRCIICPYESGNSAVKVVAEFCQDQAPSMQGQTLKIAEEVHVRQALTLLEPILLEQSANTMHIFNGAYSGQEGNHSSNGSTAQVLEGPKQSILMVATCYQDQPNGLICLYQCDRPRMWSEAEIDLVRELADQVGTAIAHATLFTASQTLANQLQKVNEDLVQKHRELEEASQQAEEASRLKSEFLANTSHELRTPLNGMIGFLKLVMDDMVDSPEEQHEFIEEAYDCAIHLMQLINDILDIARIEAGKMQLELSPVNLNELLSAVENFSQRQIQAQQKNLNFEINLPPTYDQIILEGNYQRLLQVMLNLVGNAIKFTHEGGITISAEVVKKKVTVQNNERPGMVKIRVADTGIGVSLDKQDKLFQSFSQVDGSRTRQYGGTGLGLAISQRLVEAMGGVVNFYSLGEGLGSTVTFDVPLFQEPIMSTTTSLNESVDLLVERLPQ
ncbi:MULTISPECIES: ATP-binding protein [Trichocoleus]|uniref:histidine kinase n=1 Tax=Trichocoleus desertorum GB2-A4 TaxID=2933944 RepID=A0ABV0JDS3_9CYAN|nr:ATP-binding protein [Trichocoleus sp. FACHB-46]MBD1861308.1 GAF domain-containing protein [Trichocoleus sp. FACHB-46]